MIDFLNSFKSLIKLEQIHTDNNLFKLHYKFTVIMLIVFSILLTSKQYFGDPINCDVAKHKAVIDTYCWIYGTYIIKTTLNDKFLPGLGHMDTSRVHRDNKELIWQKYYQWVCIVFCFQALLFYLPRYIWKTWEGGRLRLLVKDLSGPLITPQWNTAAKEKLVKYLMNEKESHNIYAVRYATCELLNFLNVVSQIYLMDWFLTGYFSIYGIAFLTFENINPMTALFPKITKCLYKNIGPSGSLQDTDALCVLPLNVLNEKLFLVLWFWLYILAVLSFVGLLYRLSVLFLPKVRMYLLMAQSRSVGLKCIRVIVEGITYGDFFILYTIGKNMNPIIYKELVLSIYDYMKNKKSYKAYSESIVDDV